MNEPSVPLDENCDGLTVKMQIRSYDKANQDVLFDIIDVKPFALTSFNPEVVYNDSTYFCQKNLSLLLGPIEAQRVLRVHLVTVSSC